MDNTSPTTTQNFKDPLAHPHMRGRDALATKKRFNKEVDQVDKKPHPSSILSASCIYTSQSVLIRVNPRLKIPLSPRPLSAPLPIPACLALQPLLC